MTSKVRSGPTGLRPGGKPLARGALYLMLQNRVYIGDIVHKDKHYPGEHRAIVPQDLWEQVQARLTDNAVKRASGTRCSHPSLLAGLLFDHGGHRMTPTHAVKGGRRYRYYVSHALITDGRSRTPDGLRIPAVDIERVVTDQIRLLLCNQPKVFEVAQATVVKVAAQQQFVDRAGELSRTWQELEPPRTRAIVRTLIERIDVREDRVDVHLLPARLAIVVSVTEPAPTMSPGVSDGARLTVSVPLQLGRTGADAQLIIDGPSPFAKATPDPSLVRLLTKAQRVRAGLFATNGATISQVAKREGLSRSYLTRLVRLSWLAPDIVRAIVDGRHPPALTSTALMQETRLPLDWRAQRVSLGFAQPAPPA